LLLRETMSIARRVRAPPHMCRAARAARLLDRSCAARAARLLDRSCACIAACDAHVQMYSY
jgi:hypothetical protein